MNCTSKPCKANITKQYLQHLLDTDLMHFPLWTTINPSTLASFSKPQLLKKKWQIFPQRVYRYIESKSFSRAPAVSIWAVKCTCLFFKKQLHFKWLIHCQKQGFSASFLQATAFSTHPKSFFKQRQQPFSFIQHRSVSTFSWHGGLRFSSENIRELNLKCIKRVQSCFGRAEGCELQQWWYTRCNATALSM